MSHPQDRTTPTHSPRTDYSTPQSRPPTELSDTDQSSPSLLRQSVHSAHSLAPSPAPSSSSSTPAPATISASTSTSSPPATPSAPLAPLLHHGPGSAETPLLTHSRQDMLTSIRTNAGAPPSASAVAAVTPAWLSTSDRYQTHPTTLGTVDPARHYPQLHLRTAQHHHHHHLPLPEREDSSRPRTITFGSLKKASMSNRSSTGSNFGKKSKMVLLPPYLRQTTFVQHFQPEGGALLDPTASLIEREPSKRRRLAESRRRHGRRHSDSSESSSSSGSGSSSSGSESGSNSHDNSGTATPLMISSPLRYQLPSRWSTVDKTEKTDLFEDDLQVHYTGPGKTDVDASAIRANRPIPPQCGIYYYEVLVKSKGNQGYIGIGVCNASVALDRLPGWEPQSWGYHGDDGNSFGGCGNGRPFGPTFTTGDTIGCGVNFRDMSLFYTKNGQYLGVAFRDLRGPLYPTIGMRTTGEIIEANFGQSDFVFNIEDYVKEEKNEAWHALEDTLGKVAAEKNQESILTQSLSELVLSYMVHHGYSESARQFSSDLVPHMQKLNDKSTEMDTQEEAPCLPMVVDTERRKLIRRTILDGDIDKAMALLEEYYPGITSSNDTMLLQLRCRKFVEMVTSSSLPLRALDQRDKKSSSNPLEASTAGPMEVDEQTSSSEGLEGLGMLKEAIQYGQFLQEQYRESKRQSVQDLLIDTFSVLAYSENDDSGAVTSSLSSSKPISRETVASTVNTAILASQNLPTTAPLETVIRQTKVILAELTRRGVGEAAFFDLEKDCLE